MRPNESTDIGSEAASTSRESDESTLKLIVFIVHD